MTTDVQRHFDFKRATKLNTLERVVCSSGVKSLLKALDAFARDATHCTVTLKRLAVSMGVSVCTARRAVRQAQAEGVLIVSGSETDGSANTYTINWQVVFDLPDGVADRRRKKSGQTPIKTESDTPINLIAPPYQVDRGPLSTCEGTPIKLIGVLSTDRNDKENDTVRLGEILTAVGGGFSSRSNSAGSVGTLPAPLENPEPVHQRASETPAPRQNPPTSQPARRGAWAGAIDKTFHAEERTRIFRAALAAGLVTDCTRDKLRVQAAILQAMSRPDPKWVTGHLIDLIEVGDWQRLEVLHVERAAGRVLPPGRRLTTDEIKRIRGLE